MSAEAGAHVARWTIPAVTDEDARTSDAGEALSIGDLEQIQKDAYDEAFAQGLAEGREHGARQSKEQVESLAALLNQLAQPFAQLDDCVEQQVVELAMVIVRNLFRRELHTDPSFVIGVVREALTALPVAARDVCVYLHPEDAALVQETLRETDGERAWRMLEDPLLTRGGCRVESATSRIDARVESRLATIASALLIDARGSAG